MEQNFKYRNGFFISTIENEVRDVRPITTCDSIYSLLSIGINSCDYQYSKNIYAKLISLNNHRFSIIENWGSSERVVFTSDSVMTEVKDLFEWKNNVQIKTFDLIQVFENRLHCMKYRNNELKELINHSFDIVKTNPQKYQSGENEFMYIFPFIKLGLEFALMLLESDLIISNDNFTSSLKLNDAYFET